MNIAKGHQPVMPYLILKDAEKFIRFCQVVFGAKEKYKGLREDGSGRIMHAEIDISGCNIMLADVTEDFGIAGANLFIYTDDADAAFGRALEQGAAVVQEMGDQNFGRSGSVEDPFGNVWWITSITST